MAYTTIDDPSAHFQTLLYTGNAAANRAITNTGNSDLQPDWIWIMPRNNSSSYYNALQDTSRGVTKILSTNTTASEVSTSAQVISVQSDGFTIDDNADSQNYVNINSLNYVAWQWKANGGSTTSFNESGSNPGGTYQANTTSGFSIITYTGTGSAGTIPHGLGKRPKWISIKSRTETEGWHVISQLITGNTNGGMILNATDAEYTGGSNNTDTGSIDTTNIHVKTSGNVNTDGQDYVAYCFAEIPGYSKFGKYTGNENTDGTFIYTGFKPAWLMMKRHSEAGNDWIIMDSTRFTFNVVEDYVRANTTDAETDQYNIDVDFLSNGFKMKGDSGNINASSAGYVYMAFAERPFVTSKGIPTTAR